MSVNEKSSLVFYPTLSVENNAIFIFQKENKW